MSQFYGTIYVLNGTCATALFMLCFQCLLPLLDPGSFEEEAAWLKAEEPRSGLEGVKMQIGIRTLGDGKGGAKYLFPSSTYPKRDMEDDKQILISQHRCLSSDLKVRSKGSNPVDETCWWPSTVMRRNLIYFFRVFFPQKPWRFHRKKDVKWTLLMLQNKGLWI